MLNRKQITALAIGGSLTLAIGGFYTIKSRTSWLISTPLHCKTFPTTDQRHPGEVSICVTGITQPYSHQNGDVELDLTFMKSHTERMQMDAQVWLADTIAGKKVDYKGEINYTRVRLFENGLLVSDRKEKFSAWINPVVPQDVHLPMWHWLHDLTPVFDRQRLPFDEKFRYFMDKVMEFAAMVATAGATLYKIAKSATLGIIGIR